MLSLHSIQFHITLRTNAGYFEVYIFHMQTCIFHIRPLFAVRVFYDFAGCKVVSMPKQLIITQIFGDEHKVK